MSIFQAPARDKWKWTGLLGTVISIAEIPYDKQRVWRVARKMEVEVLVICDGNIISTVGKICSHDVSKGLVMGQVK
jgi:hypothetical protein